MINNGNTLIKRIFRRREECVAVCAELATRSEADSDRRDIRMFETGLSIEQYGDYEQSTGNAAQEAESLRLITIAKEYGLYVERSDWEKFGNRKQQPSGESIVFLTQDSQEVIKLRSPFAKSTIKQMHVQDAIYEHLIHNILFPTTRYRFKEISEDAGGVRIILSQKYISDIFTIPTQKEIDRYLIEGLGLKKVDRYFYGNDLVAVTDVFAEGDNVLADCGKLYFIDPIIKFKKPASEVLEYYYKKLK